MAFAYYRSITVDKTKCGSADSANFPVLVSGVYSWLASTANGGLVTSASGFDIVPYSDSALTTKLAFERVSWNATTGAIELWVKLPNLTVATNAVFYLAASRGRSDSRDADPDRLGDGDLALEVHGGDGREYCLLTHGGEGRERAHGRRLVGI
jgi:hypothetical protein